MVSLISDKDLLKQKLSNYYENGHTFAHTAIVTKYPKSRFEWFFRFLGWIYDFFIPLKEQIRYRSIIRRAGKDTRICWVCIYCKCELDEIVVGRRRDVKVPDGVPLLTCNEVRVQNLLDC
jgi:hypothetical protein